MRLKIVDFDILEFRDLSGAVRVVRGLPLTARAEFRARVQALTERLMIEAETDEPLSAIYDRDEWVQHQVAKCLELFGLDPAGLSFDMARQLLLNRFEDGQYRDGLLMELEFPPRDRPKSDSDLDDPPTDAEILAAVASHTGSIQSAYDIAEDPRISGRQLLDIMSARAEASDPEVRKKAESEKRRKKYRKMMLDRGEDPDAPVGTGSFDFLKAFHQSVEANQK